MAAGTVTVSETVHGNVKKIAFSWTSGTGAEGGTASGTTTHAYDGKLIGITTIPSGAAAPTDNYDLTLTDIGTHDVLLGAGANRDTADQESVAEASLGAVAASKLTLAVANAGDSKAGTLIVWVR
jgi:hypothetical protein